MSLVLKVQPAPLQVNHISPQSEQFQDFLAKGDASEYAEMFVDWDKLWPEGACRSPCVCVSPAPRSAVYTAGCARRSTDEWSFADMH